MRINKFAIALLIPLAGCFPVARNRVMKWDRVNTTQADFMSDRYRCMKEAAMQDGIDCPLWIACMGAAGYSQNPDGAFYPQRSEQFMCRQDIAAAAIAAQIRANSIQAAGQALQNGIQQGFSQPSYQAPTQTNCYRIGNQINCTSR